MAQSQVSPDQINTVTVSNGTDWIKTSGPDGHFSDALRLSLKNIALNQFKCFDALNREYPNMLKNKEYDDKEGNSEAFWESIVVDYENYMELLAKNEGVASWTVSREVELVWRVHALNPVHYVKDCLRRFGKVIPHRSNDPNAVYPAHSQQAFREKVIGNKAPRRTGFITKDLVMTDALKRQCDYVRKMVELDMKKTTVNDYIETAIDGYQQFLNLAWSADKPKGLRVVPTLSIDLIWHSHQLDPVGYQSFCVWNSPDHKMMGHNGNAEEGLLKQNADGTESFWNKKYGEMLGESQLSYCLYEGRCI